VLLPDSGRSYLSKYFDDDWLRRLGFLDEPSEDTTGDTTVGQILAKADPSPLTPLPADISVGEALARTAAVTHRSDLRPVVPPRKGGSTRPNVAETLGAVSVSALRRLVDSDGAVSATSVSAHAGEPLAAVGIGEFTREASARIRPGQSAVWVLVDGRVVGVVTRDELAAAQTDRAGATPGR
jgi:cystathionine beta-synthase